MFIDLSQKRVELLCYPSESKQWSPCLRKKVEDNIGRHASSFDGEGEILQVAVIKKTAVKKTCNLQYDKEEVNS